MPRGVLRHDIEEDVAVDQNRSHSIVAGQRHDRIGGHCNVAAAAQMGHKASPPAVLAADLGSDDPYDLAVKLEFDFGMWEQTRPLADLGGDGRLSFGRNTHGANPYSYT